MEQSRELQPEAGLLLHRLLLRLTKTSLATLTRDAQGTVSTRGRREDADTWLVPSAFRGAELGPRRSPHPPPHSARPRLGHSPSRDEAWAAQRPPPGIAQGGGTGRCEATREGSRRSEATGVAGNFDAAKCGRAQWPPPPPPRPERVERRSLENISGMVSSVSASTLRHRSRRHSRGTSLQVHRGE
ncbi:unnamed protein product [Lampetra planeri]